MLFVSCQKDETLNQVSNEKPISVEVIGSLSDLEADGDTKAGVSSVVRLDWTNGDVCYAFDKNKCLGSLTATVDPANKSIAILGGTISKPAGSIITIVYTNISNGQPAISSGKLSFDFSEQTLDKIPFVVYGTVEYAEGRTTISNLTIPFNFASSVLKVAVTGLVDGVEIDKVFPGGINTKCELNLSNDAPPTITGTTAGNIILTKGSKSFSLAGGKTIVNFGVVKTAARGGSDANYPMDITFKQGSDYKWSMLLKNHEIKEQKSIYTVVNTNVDVPYVEIEADYDNDPSTPNTILKWYKENLTLTDSGKKLVKGTRKDGTNSGHMFGDWFQWAAYENYALPVQDLGNGKTDKGVLIYESFTNNVTVDGNGGDYIKFKFKTFPSTSKTYRFYYSSSDTTSVSYYPYMNPDPDKHYKATKYMEYTPGVNYYLELTDDVANIILGENWRIPTDVEFKALFKASYTLYTGSGAYIWKPVRESDANKIATTWNADYDWDDVLLFLPSSYQGSFPSYAFRYQTSRSYPNSGSANTMRAGLNSHNYEDDIEHRSWGVPVRPVSN